jgi:hypothetical protein
MIKRMSGILSLALLLGLVCSSSARAQDPAPEASTPAAAEKGLSVGLGVDYRSVCTYFYFYDYPIAGYSEQDAGLAFVMGDFVYEFPVSDTVRLGPGLALGAGYGSGTFETSGTDREDVSVGGYQVEALGQLAWRATSSLDVLGRLGLGVTGTWHDAAGESAFNLLLGAGVEFPLSATIGLALMAEVAVANLGGTSDAEVRSSEPSLDSYENYAIQARVVIRP